MVYLHTNKRRNKMKFLKIAGTFVLGASIVSLASAPKLPTAQAQEFITIETPMVISVKR